MDKTALDRYKAALEAIVDLEASCGMYPNWGLRNAAKLAKEALAIRGTCKACGRDPMRLDDARLCGDCAIEIDGGH